MEVDESGKAGVNVVLIEGMNILSAKSVNRAGESPMSTKAGIFPDTSIPDAPAGLARSRAGGTVTPFWHMPSCSIGGFNIWRVFRENLPSSE